MYPLSLALVCGTRIEAISSIPWKGWINVAIGGNFYPEPNEELDCLNKCTRSLLKL